MLILLLIVGLLLLYKLETLLFCRLWEKGLSLDLQFGEDYLYCRETGHLYETITNDKFLPMIAVSIRIAVSRFLIFNGHSEANTGGFDMSYKRDVFTLMPKQKIRRTLTFVARKRGCYKVDSADLKAYDFLFAKSYFKTVATDTRTYVYPARLDLSQIRLLNRSLSGTVLKQNALNPDPLAFSSIRDYEPGDNIRHINWKATAKSDRYMVNQYDATTEITVVIYLDLEDNYIRKSEELIEESISIAASLATLCMDHKLSVSLVSNSGIPWQEKGSPLQLSSDSTHANIHQWLRALACIDSQHVTQSIYELAKDPAYAIDDNRIHVVISKNLTKENRETFEERSKSSGQVMWICPYSRYGEAPQMTETDIIYIPWKVNR